MAKDDKNKKDTKKDVKKKDKTPKVTPSKDKGQNSLKNKARNLIMNHPQITQNARGLFRNENGKTIVEEIVHRGDPSTKEVVMPRNQGDLTEDDLRSLAVHASTLVNKDVQKYDPILASEEALSMSIRTKDGGKYDGRVNASTFQLILEDMKGMKKIAEDQSEEQEEIDIPSSDEGEGEGEEETPSSLERHKETMKRLRGIQEGRKKKQQEHREQRQEDSQEPQTQEPNKDKPKKSPEESTMDKAELKKEKEAILRKLAAVEELLEDEKDVDAGEEDYAKVNTNDPAEPKDTDDESPNPVTASLDRIAGELEKQNDEDLFKMAFQIDQISDILEGKKEAATFQSDPDEKFMKTFFKGGLHEGDSDESYMKEYNTDVSKEVNDVKDKKSGKEASKKLPYQKYLG